VVQATGHSGEKSFPSSITGINDFKGDVLCHSSEFIGAKPNSQGKKAIVVGCCNSGHDIAQDFYENGYDVTLVQRSSTYVMSSEAGLQVLLGGLYEEGGVSFSHSPLCCDRFVC
jgi:cation diffusion facilitator CzcD-associated flavoprotein CzcO